MTGNPQAICAFAGCLAGWVILRGAPRVVEHEDGSFGGGWLTMHPGCAEARRRSART